MKTHLFFQKELPFLRSRELSSPLGPMLALAGEKGICFLSFLEESNFFSHKERFCRLMKKRASQYENPQSKPSISFAYLERLEKELKEYFQGERREFQVPLELMGTPFQLRAWEILKSVPYGETCSYGEQAERLGNPKAIRAVARANSQNYIAVLLPCHRIIGKDGSLRGYGGGLWRKDLLLKLEQGFF